MIYYRKNLIIKFFLNKGWSILRIGNMFTYLQPAKTYKFPSGYTIDIPNEDLNVGFNNYIDNMLWDISALFGNQNSPADLKSFFSKDVSILKHRIFDAENNDGSISFEKHLLSLESIKKALKQTASFVTTNKNIFSNSDFEANLYFSQCRTLQTEIGSFVSNFELPNEPIITTVSQIESAEINNRFIDVVEFVKSEIIETHSIPEINENYIQDNKQYLNYELIHSIKDIYYKPKINNIEYNLFSSENIRKVNTKKVLPRIRYYNLYLSELRKILLNLVPLDIVGKVKKLYSNSPLSSNKNEVNLFVVIAGQAQNVRLYLNSEDYQLAIDAHKFEKDIHIVGRARQNKNLYYISELDVFEVMD